MRSMRKIATAVGIVAMVLTAGCSGSDSDSATQSPTIESKPSSTAKSEGQLIDVRPYLEEKGFVLVSMIRANYAAELFPFPTNTGKPLCGFVISNANAEWDVSDADSLKSINRTDIKVVARMVRYASGNQGVDAERGAKIILRMDELTPQKLKDSFDTSRCGDTTVASQ